MTDHSFMIEDEKSNQEVLCISEVTKAAICEEFESVKGGPHQNSTAKADF